MRGIKLSKETEASMDYLSEEFLESYHRRIIEQAKTDFLLKQREVDKPSLQERVLSKAGESLISMGLTLKTWSQTQGKYNEIPRYEANHGH